MKVTGDTVKANNLRRGDIVIESGGMYVVNSADHAMTGKRTACVQVQMKGLKIGSKDARGSMNKRYMPDEIVSVVTIVEEACTFLYMEGEQIVVMRAEDKGADLVSLDKQDDYEWLSDNMVIAVFFTDGQPLYWKLPERIDVEVASAESGAGHHRVTSSYKSATLTNGKVVQVPPFVKDGERITIKTEDFSYISKAK
jgi:elongation factor P